MKSYETYQVTEEHQGLTVEYYLKNILGCSGRKIQKLTRVKGILLNNKPVFLQRKVKAGDRIKVLNLQDKSYGVVPEPGTVQILYEDSELVVVNKPARMLVHPTGRTERGTLANYLAHYFQQQGQVLTIRPLHRLDRDTTGCVVFAKKAGIQSELEQQLKQGMFKRIYWALVPGRVEPPLGEIDLPLGTDELRPNRRTVHEQGERAVTRYRTLMTELISELSMEVSLLELNLITGKTHQIRVHLAHIGHPVLGDRMYGKPSPLISRQALHARTVTFIHPANGQEVTVQAPWPEDFSKIINWDEKNN